jgi:hypothetical protein
MLHSVMTKTKRYLPASVLAFFRAKGSEGGKLGGAVGGKLRWKGVPAAERSAIAKRAVAARETKRAAKKATTKKAGR